MEPGVRGGKQVLAAPTVAFSEGRPVAEGRPGRCTPRQDPDAHPVCLGSAQAALFSQTRLRRDHEQQQGSPRTLSLRMTIRKPFEGMTTRSKAGNRATPFAPATGPFACLWPSEREGRREPPPPPGGFPLRMEPS